MPRRYVTFRKILNYWHAQAEWLLATERVRSRPYKLTLELTNVCNLRCPHCPTGQGRFGREASFMDMGCLQRILDELAPYAFMVDLHNWGESLLHKKACDAIRMCEEHGVMTVISTNFNVPLDERRAEDLVRSRLSVLGVSMDGPDQESYQIYRVRGRLALALNNVRLVQEAKKRLGSSTPRIAWTYIVFRHNQHRVAEAQALAEQYGMEFCASRGITDDPAWETTEMFLHPLQDIARQGPSCRWLYNMGVVNADLGVSPCCTGPAFSREADFGDVRTSTFAAVWNNARFRAARRLFRPRRARGGGPTVAVCCEGCPVYTGRPAG